MFKRLRSVYAGVDGGSLVKVLLNGESVEIEAGVTVDHLLQRFDYQCERVAVAINENFVPRSTYCEAVVFDGDRIDVVAPVQGG